MKKDPVDDLIDKLGGLSTVARAFGMSRQGVASMKKKGIPAAYLRAMCEVADQAVEPLLEVIETRAGVDKRALVAALKSEVRRFQKE